MNQEVMLFKLASGEELIAKVVEMEGVVFVVDKPYAFTFEKQGEDVVKGIIPFMSDSSDVVSLNSHQIVATSYPTESAKKSYLVTIGDIPNIEIVDKKILKG